MATVAGGNDEDSSEIISTNHVENLSESEDEPAPLSTTMLLSMDKRFLEQRIDELTKFKRYQELVLSNRDNLTQLEGQVVSESDLLEGKCLEFIKNYAIESTQLSHLIQQSARENPRDPFTEEVLSLLTDNARLSEKIINAKNELNKAKETLILKTQELESLAEEKRQLRDDIKQSENQYTTGMTTSLEMEKSVTLAKEQIEGEKRKLEIISALGMRMIFASGVDWIESEEVMNMLSTFGKDIPENMN